MISVVRIVALVLSVVAVSVPGAYAQGSGADRPWRGLFGQNPSTSNHVISAFGNVFTGYDSNRLRELPNVQPGPGEERFYSSGPLTGGTVGIGYSGTVGPVSLNASAGVGLRYYPDEGRTLIVPTNAGGAGSGFTWGLGRRTRLVLNGSVGYRPYYTLATAEAPLDEHVPTPATDEDLALAQQPSLSTAGDFYVEHDFSRLTSFQAGYSTYYRYFFTDEATAIYGNNSQQRAYGRLTRQMSRYMSLRAGYAYRWFTNTNGDRLPIHQIDAGVDYNRALSLSRETTVSFNVGTSAQVDDRAGAPTEDSQADTQLRFRLNGNATLSRLIGRSWIASVGYQRGIDYVDGFNEPFNRDSFTAQVGGLINRRVTAQAAARYSFGYVGFTRGEDNDFGNLWATAGLSAALNRFLAAYLNVYYYDYAFGSDVVVPGLIAPDQQRLGARAGLATSVPIWP